MDTVNIRNYRTSIEDETEMDIRIGRGRILKVLITYLEYSPFYYQVGKYRVLRVHNLVYCFDEICFEVSVEEVYDAPSDDATLDS